MAGLNKKEITNKPLRLDARMAKDIEILSESTGYSQNEIVVMATKRYLLENRKYFVKDLVENMCLSILEHEIAVMHEESHMIFGPMKIDIVKTSKSGIYSANVILKNKFDEVLFDDSREIDITTEEWEYYKEYLYENIMKYVDFDEQVFRNYFQDKFSYE